jgi:hypothetical protein
MLAHLGGWWRLWFVISLVLGGSVYAMEFEPNPKRLDWFEAVPTTIEVDHEKWRDERLRGRQCAQAVVFPVHVAPKGRPQDGFIFMSCTPNPDYLSPLLKALVPGAFLLGVGLTFAWVAQGFRHGRRSSNELRP